MKLIADSGRRIIDELEIITEMEVGGYLGFERTLKWRMIKVQQAINVRLAEREREALLRRTLVRGRDRLQIHIDCESESVCLILF